MRAKRFHGLKRVKFRQSWNKFNLYNLSRLPRSTLSTSHFKQKFIAKSVTRAYHGEQIPEKQWERMFSSKLRAVVPMRHQYLAQHDGSEQARGRGSGLDEDPNSTARRFKYQSSPYMHMTYAPMERRLDTAIFRALFASSTRQARQFVTHGAVKVNGKRMIYPGYLLNPGDMFQVDPERVLFATGAPKTAQERRATSQARRRAAVASRSEETGDESTTTTPGEESDSDSAPVTIVAEEADDQGVSKRKAYKASLKDLLDNAKRLLSDQQDVPSAKRKQNLRTFARTVRSALSNVNRTAVESIDEQLTKLVDQLSISGRAKESALTGTTEPASAPKVKISERDRQALREALQEVEDNPIDESKPYATPWQPRPYMQPFVFIPRYLEVNQNICSAVYLRHPVVRPGSAEVPTPFPYATSQLAFSWYLRRR